MMCPKCCSELPNGSLFCSACGTKIVAPNPSTPVSVPPKKNNTLLYVLIGVAAVAVIVAIVCVVLLFASPGKSDDAVIPTEAKLTTEAVTDAPEPVEPETVIVVVEKVVEVPQEVTPSSKNLIDDMSKSERTTINTFLSNFSEAFYKSSEGENKNYENLSFAFTHNYINSDSKILYSGNRMGISAKNANATLDKYMGTSVPLKTIESSIGLSDWYFDGTNFWTDAGGGESYAYYSVAEDMRDNGDGTYTVYFDTYFDQFSETGLVSKECYSYTANQASGNSQFCNGGKAIVRKKVYNNKNTYELLSYNV